MRQNLGIEDMKNKRKSEVYGFFFVFLQANCTGL